MTVVLSGLYHGVNPAMGWPLAVSAGLMERRPYGLLAAPWPLAVGHLLAMLAVLLPFALLITSSMAAPNPDRRGAPGHRLWHLHSLEPRHPRAFARIPPTQLGLWSFAVAIAHGAGLDAGADLSWAVLGRE